MPRRRYVRPGVEGKKPESSDSPSRPKSGGRPRDGLIEVARHGDPDESGAIENHRQRRRLAGRPRGTGGRAEELSPEEIRRIDKMLTGRHELRNRALLYLGLGSGMRIGELVGLQVQDVAPHGHVRGRIILEKHSTKSKRSRTVAVSKQAVQHLQAYLRNRFPPPSKPSGPLFPGQNRQAPQAGRQRTPKPMTTTNAIMTLKRMFQAAGVETASTHSLRRTHANTLRRNGVDLKVIQEQLGHSSLAITERYFEVDPLEAQRAVEALRF